MFTDETLKSKFLNRFSAVSENPKDYPELAKLDEVLFVDVVMALESGCSTVFAKLSFCRTYLGSQYREIELQINKVDYYYDAMGLLFTLVEESLSVNPISTLIMAAISDQGNCKSACERVSSLFNRLSYNQELDANIVRFASLSTMKEVKPDASAIRIEFDRLVNASQVTTGEVYAATPDMSWKCTILGKSAVAKSKRDAKTLVVNSLISMHGSMRSVIDALSEDRMSPKINAIKCLMNERSCRGKETFRNDSFSYTLTLDRDIYQGPYRSSKTAAWSAWVEDRLADKGVVELCTLICKGDMSCVCSEHVVCGLHGVMKAFEIIIPTTKEYSAHDYKDATIHFLKPSKIMMCMLIFLGILCSAIGSCVYDEQVITNYPLFQPFLVTIGSDVHSRRLTSIFDPASWFGSSYNLDPNALVAELNTKLSTISRTYNSLVTNVQTFELIVADDLSLLSANQARVQWLAQMDTMNSNNITRFLSRAMDSEFFLVSAVINANDQLSYYWVLYEGPVGALTYNLDFYIDGTPSDGFSISGGTVKIMCTYNLPAVQFAAFDFQGFSSWVQTNCIRQYDVQVIPAGSIGCEAQAKASLQHLQVAHMALVPATNPISESFYCNPASMMGQSTPANAPGEIFTVAPTTVSYVSDDWRFDYDVAPFPKGMLEIQAPQCVLHQPMVAGECPCEVTGVCNSYNVVNYIYTPLKILLFDVISAAISDQRSQPMIEKVETMSGNEVKRIYKVLNTTSSATCRFHNLLQSGIESAAYSCPNRYASCDGYDDAGALTLNEREYLEFAPIVSSQWLVITSPSPQIGGFKELSSFYSETKNGSSTILQPLYSDLMCDGPRKIVGSASVTLSDSCPMLVRNGQSYQPAEIPTFQLNQTEVTFTITTEMLKQVNVDNLRNLSAQLNNLFLNYTSLIVPTMAPSTISLSPLQDVVDSIGSFFNGLGVSNSFLSSLASVGIDFLVAVIGYVIISVTIWLIFKLKCCCCCKNNKTEHEYDVELQNNPLNEVTDKEVRSVKSAIMALSPVKNKSLLKDFKGTVPKDLFKVSKQSFVVEGDPPHYDDHFSAIFEEGDLSFEDFKTKIEGAFADPVKMGTIYKFRELLKTNLSKAALIKRIVASSHTKNAFWDTVDMLYGKKVSFTETGIKMEA